MQSAIRNRTSAILLLLFAAMPLAAGVSNINMHTYYFTINDAVLTAFTSNTLHISTGTYVGTVSVAGKHLTLVGGFDMDCATLVGAKPIILVTNGTAVDVSGNTTCILSNLVITGALNSGLRVVGTSRATCHDCVITNNVAPFGGGINVDFRSSVRLLGTEVGWNRASYDGGGAYLFGGMLTVDRMSSLHDNAARQGGGVIIQQFGGLTIQGTSVVCRNTATVNGGGIHASNTMVQIAGGVVIGGVTTNDGNVAQNFGGGFWAADSSVILADSSVRGNATVANDGGGCHIEGGTSMTASNVVVADNVAGAFSGGIDGFTASGTTSTMMTLDHVVVSNNTAVGYSAGGIYWQSTTALVVRSSTIVGNRAGLSAGGIYANLLDMRDAAVTLNRAVRYGGGMILSERADMVNCTIGLNVADVLTNGSYGGGGIAIAGGSVRFGTSEIVSNSASSGGGFWMSGGSIDMVNASVNGNRTLGNNGGGCHIEGPASVTASNTVFVGNVAARYSGAMDVDTVSGDPTTKTAVVVLDHVLVSNNIAAGRDAGGIGWYEGSSLVIRSSVLVGNSAAVNGGAAYLAAKGTISMHDTTVTGNRTGRHGGGIIAVGGSVDVVNCSFTRNIADTIGGQVGIGGGIAVFGTALRLAADGGALDIMSNAAAVGGGICLSYQATVTVVGVTAPVRISGNSAALDGGGVGVGVTSLFSAVNCQFEDNQCTNAGGGVYVDSGEALLGGTFGPTGTVTQPPCVLRNNRAGVKGGAVDVGGSAAHIAVAAALVAGNDAGDGGAASVLDGRLSMINAVVVGNGGSSAIVGEGTGKALLLNCTIADNAGGVRVTNVLGMTNCIVWGNSGIQVAAGGGSDISYSDVQNGGVAGTGNIDSDPFFVATNILNYQLHASSPCNNTGAPLAGIVTNDCLGVARPQLGGWDMGAYEFVPEPTAATLLVIGYWLFVARRKMSVRHTHFI